MKVAISGPRGDGSAWPGIGGCIEVPEHEALDLFHNDFAVPAVDLRDGVETAVLPGEEKRDVIVESDGHVDTSARDALVPNRARKSR